MFTLACSPLIRFQHPSAHVWCLGHRGVHFGVVSSEPLPAPECARPVSRTPGCSLWRAFLRIASSEPSSFDTSFCHKITFSLHIKTSFCTPFYAQHPLLKSLSFHLHFTPHKCTLTSSTSTGTLAINLSSHLYFHLLVQCT